MRKSGKRTSLLRWVVSGLPAGTFLHMRSALLRGRQLNYAYRIAQIFQGSHVSAFCCARRRNYQAQYAAFAGVVDCRPVVGPASVCGRRRWPSEAYVIILLNSKHRAEQLSSDTQLPELHHSSGAWR